jgi:hypothetical protein
MDVQMLKARLSAIGFGYVVRLNSLPCKTCFRGVTRRVRMTKWSSLGITAGDCVSGAPTIRRRAHHHALETRPPLLPTWRPLQRAPNASALSQAVPSSQIHDGIELRGLTVEAIRAA